VDIGRDYHFLASRIAYSRVGLVEVVDIFARINIPLP
jgi:hypothetical protein